MKILITNDDSINAPVLPYLAEWAKTKGDVTVIVPEFEQSGKSHSIELRHSFRIVKNYSLGDTRTYTVDSSPADCIRYAAFVLKEEFDLVISGINRGLNLGYDISYSGTLGAAFEAEFQHMKCLALSTVPKSFDNALKNLDLVYDFVMNNKLFDCTNIVNVNFPSESHGIKITRQGGIYYSDKFTMMENDMFMPDGYLAHVPGDDLSFDTNAISHGYISVSLLKCNYTDNEAFEKLKNLNM